ncbi:MAG: Fe-S cluster assembly ATPase SufC [Planctomycetota bacterium]|nr:Fe-S cluster assembly ATPase SufC [Planctomycetota bacterium]MCX8040735.1 Fe-S cluster assembly ATPase SufC [Planctomycetota bacterium]
MLEIADLSVAVAGRTVIERLSLAVPAGSLHAVMGPNGSGKSSLAKALAGHPAYAVTGGSVRLAGRDLLALAPEERVHAGLFVGMQYPTEVPGVNNGEFLRLAANAVRRARGLPERTPSEFAPLLAAALQASEAPEDFAQRQLNAGMSGGQKKRNEILQMFVLEPSVAVLDETDSGLDIDAIKAVARAINAYRRADRALVLITHFPRLLELVQPDRVHVLVGGRLVASGDAALAARLEAEGYERFRA